MKDRAHLVTHNDSRDPGVSVRSIDDSLVTRSMMDVGEVLLGHDPDEVAKARSRAKNTWPPIVGFTVGCGIGAACESAVGLWSLALPTGLALVAFAMGFAAVTEPVARAS
jgi:uncharacterized membrane protein YoaK (UPF0700 family)